MTVNFVHKSVLLRESVDWIVTDPKGIYVDCTLGGAGHSHAIAEELDPEGLLIGIDQDEDAIMAASKRLEDAACKVKIVHSNFRNLGTILEGLNLQEVDGIFFDLGVSSYQLDTPERGFSYMHDGPLDMRMDQEGKLTAADVVNTYKEEDLADLIYKYGEERWSRRIAQFIVEKRKEKPLRTTSDLVSVIKAAIPKKARQDGPHPAKRTFQAIRIEVNDELKILDSTMETAVKHLKKGGTHWRHYLSFFGRPHHQAKFQTNGQRLHLSAGTARLCVRAQTRTKETEGIYSVGNGIGG